MRARAYTGPLGILAAGAIGLSLICSVSAMATGDLNRYISITLEPISIVGLAVANFETAAALTEQMVTDFVPTETLIPTGTPVPASLTPLPTDTQRRFVTITPTITRRPRNTPTRVVAASRTPTRLSTRIPTRTPTRIPTRTPLPPTRTNTPVPPPTDTNTPVPPDTNTPIPPDTNTPIPPDTNTPIPPDTNTPIPQETTPPVDTGPSQEPAPGLSSTPPS